MVSLYGPNVVAAYVIALRLRDLMNTPGWGFGLASSSLVGQFLGDNDEDEAGAYAQDTLRFAVSVYSIAATFVFVLADPIGRLFVDDPSILSTAVPLIRSVPADRMSRYQGLFVEVRQGWLPWRRICHGASARWAA